MEIKPTQNQPLEPKGRPEKVSEPAPSAKPAEKDSVEVSDSVAAFTDTARRLRDSLSELSVERTDLLRAVQRMLEDGSIDNDQVLSDTADAILRSDD
ncbi:MAG: hypothetical protein RL885_12180 [Planctomycetota bacterium]